jgi:hypothetical protein
MALLFKNIKNKYQNHDISSIDLPSGMPVLSKDPEDQTEQYSNEFER